MKITSIFFLFCIFNFINPQKIAAQNVSVDFQIFYDDLSPYGTWVDDSQYGYVWIPDVAPGFSPYATNGHWIFTDAGWTWVSDYPWGWATFHYGRWYNDGIYGPTWVPDYEWGPGWVSWRSSDEYFGWTPLRPGTSINIAYGSGHHRSDKDWRFVQNRNFGRTDLNKYYVNVSDNGSIINNSRVINNIRTDRVRNVTYNAGPERKDAERRVGKSFKPVTIRERNTPGHNLHNNQLNIYRPRLQNNLDKPKPAPHKVASLNEAISTVQRRAVKPQQRNNQPVKQQTPQQKKTLPGKRDDKHPNDKQNTNQL
ncbi:hypothetical protein GALL_121150 [mine drainage metagenome]|uniref:Uncharacterized protein n=1 Tax=mine drainage metagenome TaxID=410659 RepID=A0A1J5SNR3_9ZZZZ